MKRKTAAALAILVSVIAICAQLKASLIEIAKAAAQGEWIPYEDPILRFSYPKGWKVWRGDQSTSRGERMWSLKPSSAAHEWGRVYVEEHADGSEKRPLRQIFTEHKENVSKVIKGPEHLALKGLKCLTYTSEDRPYGSCGDEIPQNENERFACIQATRRALCYNARKNYLDIFADLSRYHESGQADELRDNNAAIFDRFLKSLEFKPVVESSSTRKGK